jgi:phospholipase/carboxylesterase
MLANSSPTQPQLIQDGPAFENSGLVHRVLEPDGPGPHPTAVMLHGRYGSEDVMWIFRRTLPRNWLLVAPRARLEDPSGGHSWVLQPQGSWPALDAFTPAVEAVVRFIQALPRYYNADLRHVYLMGFSQGAAVSYAAAMRHSGLTQGIAGLVGFVPEGCDTAVDIAGLQDLPVFMAVGKQDPLIPYERSVACAHALQTAGARLTYHEYDTGHKLNGQGMQDLAAWWAARNRERYKQQRL